jgi:predicted CoA-binding protein
VVKKKDGIKVFWMQLGIYNEDAERKAKENGIDVVYNRCMMENTNGYSVTENRQLCRDRYNLDLSLKTIVYKL